MPARLTDEAACAVMHAAGFEPLEPYTNADTPWRCRCVTCEHEVEPSYHGVRKGKGCAYCARTRVDPVEAAEVMWAAGLEPLESYPGRNSAEWRCRCTACQREVTPTYANLRKGQGGCAYCAGGRVDPVEAIAVMRAAGLEPLETYPGNSVPWRCQCVACQRMVTPNYKSVSRGGGCAYCARKPVDPAEAVEVLRAAGLEPLEPYRNSDVPWRCRCVTCQREVAPAYGAVRSKQGGCAYCGGTRVDLDEAVEVMRAAGLEPLEPYPGAGLPWRCHCAICQREVTPSYSNVQRGQSGCAYCAGGRVDPVEAIAVMRAAGLEPLEPYPGRNSTAWKCRCITCQREVAPVYASVKTGGGCAYCAGTRVDLAEAVEVMRSAGLEPLEPYSNAGLPWRCRCIRCEREVTPRYATVRSGGGGCEACGRQSTALKLRTPTDKAIAVMRAAGLEPMEPYPGRSSAAWKCRCITCEREVAPSYSAAKNGRGCAWCSQRRVDPVEAVEVMRAAGLEPLEPYRNSDVPWRCRCLTCQREVAPSYSNTRKDRGCRFCAPSGMDYTAPGIVYLMHHPQLFCLKIGISTTAARTIRVDAHAKTGWNVIQTWDTPSGDDAERIEQQILDWWRNELGAPIALTKAEMPRGGWSETAALIHVDIDWTIDRVNRLVSQLGDPASD